MSWREIFEPQSRSGERLKPEEVSLRRWLLSLGANEEQQPRAHLAEERAGSKALRQESPATLHARTEGQGRGAGAQGISRSGHTEKRPEKWTRLQGAPQRLYPEWHGNHRRVLSKRVFYSDLEVLTIFRCCPREQTTRWAKRWSGPADLG